MHFLILNFINELFYFFVANCIINLEESSKQVLVK